jgi:hypothetical protein
MLHSTAIKGADYQALSSATSLKSPRNWFEKCPIRVTRPTRRSLAGFFVSQRRELARKSGEMKKPRSAIAGRETLGKDNAKGIAAGNPARVTILSPLPKPATTAGFVVRCGQETNSSNS